jgi:hypothetical protein
MKQETACDRCGLRAVRHELERRGIMMRFCDLCYWGELERPAPTLPPNEGRVEPTTARGGQPINR